MLEMHKCICDYVDARNAYEAATAPLNSHARTRSLRYDDPILIRWRDSRIELLLMKEKYL